MYASTLLTTLFALITLVAAAPTFPKNMTDFYLVTTVTRVFWPNSTQLPFVNATSFFDPYHQEDYLLRWTDPGYGSLPTFNFGQGSLRSKAINPVGFKEQEYRSTCVEDGKELTFEATLESGSNLGLDNGYLLTVGGTCEGWTVCDGELGQSVISWKGTDPSCVKRYIHAVRFAPY